MEFWGVEVKSGEPLKVLPGDGMILHLSQASLGELKKGKGNESACLFVNVDGKKLVLGTLSIDKFPQQQFDLVFDRNFELSHNWKSGSVYFCGYKATNPVEEFAATELPEGEFDDSESEEDIPLHLANNGKPESIAKKDKPAEAERASAIKEKKSDAGKQKVKIVEPKKDEGPLEEESSDDDFVMTEDDEEDEDDSDDDSDESDDEETPQKVEPIKKRQVDSAIKTPVPEKKAKVTPQKSDGKKGGGHVATPHPAKQAGKTPANQPNKQTPKSGGAHSCKSCNKTFGSDQALDSHTKAKHDK